MSIRPRRRGLDPMITMINVVFLLLAIFMLGQFDRPRPATISLPQAASGERTDADTLIFIENQGLTEEELFRQISRESLRDAQVVVSADRNLDANALIQALSLIRANGANIVSIEVIR